MDKSFSNRIHLYLSIENCNNFYFYTKNNNNNNKSNSNNNAFECFGLAVALCFGSLCIVGV